MNDNTARIPDFFNGSFEPFLIGKGLPNVVKASPSSLFVIAGPCAIENCDHALSMCDKIQRICNKYGLKFVFKSCFDKDCRSSSDSFHGVGVEVGSSILNRVRHEFGVPVVSDFSVPTDAALIAPYIDMIQVPAYLCRQTSILRAAAQSQLPVHLKKGQFMSPWNLKNSVNKLRSFGCKDIVLTDRGTFFGYNMLVNDFRSLKIMSDLDVAVGYDATHSIQLPTSMGTLSGGQREFIPFLSRAAAASGINAIFIEVHDDPPRALSDPNTVLHIDDLDAVLNGVNTIHSSLSILLQS